MLQLGPYAFVLRDQDNQSMVTYHPNYLPKEEADALLNFMLTGVPWTAERPVMFGKPVETRRKTYAFGDVGMQYSYSGTTKTAFGWTENLRSVRDRLAQSTGDNFNFALANLYPDGKAGIGAHSDDEPGIKPSSAIVGLSLGSTRDFVLTGKASGEKHKVTLEHGSIVVMWLDTQRHYKHAVPPRASVKDPRVNLTFRVMV